MSRRGKRRRANQAAVWFALPSLCGVTLFLMLPLAEMIQRSFYTAMTEGYVGISNYRAVFQNEAFRLACRNTLRFVAVCLPLLIGLGLLIAVCLARFSAVRFVKTLFLLPMAIPGASLVLVWKMAFAGGGFLNGFLTWASGVWGSGTVYRAEHMGSKTAFYVLVFSYVWKNLGYTVVLWLAGILSVPVAIKEAARMDGAGRVKCFLSIELPNLKPVLYTITVLSFLNSFKVFREAYLVAGSYPDESIYLLQHLFNNWFVNLEYDRMAAAAVIMGGTLFAFIWLLQRIWEKEGVGGSHEK